MIYSIGRLIVRFVAFFMFRLKIKGRENIPKEGGAIFAVNHRSYWDVIMAGLACPRHLRFMAKSELFRNKFFGGLIRLLGAFPVHRGKGDIGAIKSALTILKNGEVMLMFPEGRRIKNNDEKILDAKAGVAMIATRAKVPVIPVYITGKYRWMHKITVNIGKPIAFDAFYGEKLTMQELQQLSNDVLKTMRELKL